ncbi:hypothetical protein ISS07_01000 [Candidatus Woesearchaeota archaeon]|nr:hypothetical protein [Candidatus Woesearchaeota archaeon]
MALEILSEQPINSYQVKKELAGIKKRDKELKFRAQKTEEHLASAAEYKDADKLYNKIEKLKIPRLREQQVHKIVDVMPTTVKDLKLILQGYTVSVTQENMKKVVDAINSTITKK